MDLSRNLISDLGPRSTLSQIMFLWLRYNPLESLEPIVATEAFGNGVFLSFCIDNLQCSREPAESDITKLLIRGG